MVVLKVVVLAVLLVVPYSQQNVHDNEVDVSADDEPEVDDESNPLADLAATLLSGGGGGQGEHGGQGADLAGMLGSLMASESGQQLGSMLLGGGGGGSSGGNNNVVTAQIIQGIGSLLSQSGGGNANTGGGFDPSMIGTVINMLGAAAESNSNAQPAKKVSGQRRQQKTEHDNGIDVGSLLSMAGSFLANQNQGRGNNGGGDLMSMLPMLLNTVQSFVGPEAQHRADNHADHAWFLPPIVEKMHIMFDHFINSDMGKNVINLLGAEKFVKVFSDENGEFSYPKFVELLENQSFRRHWIRIVTHRIAEGVRYFSDPQTQKSYLSTVQFIVNNFLKGQNIPAIFDPTRPTESISNLADHLSKKYFDFKVDSRPYVKPAVLYIQDMFRLAENRGYVGKSIDSSELSHKLTDTINLEIIEPVAKINRAYRFARKNPKCDKYVICMANRELNSAEGASLPGLKSALSKGSSMIASWFISGYSGTPFWSLYNIITEENSCKRHYLDACNAFHIEEIKTTTEYVHNEL